MRNRALDIPVLLRSGVHRTATGIYPTYSQRSGKSEDVGYRRVWLAVGMLAGLALVQLWVGNRMVTYGVEVAAKSRELSGVREANQRMRQELAERGTLTWVAREAERWGFGPAGEVLSVGGLMPVAERLGESWRF